MPFFRKCPRCGSIKVDRHNPDRHAELFEFSHGHYKSHSNLSIIGMGVSLIGEISEQIKKQPRKCKKCNYEGTF